VTYYFARKFLILIQLKNTKDLIYFVASIPSRFGIYISIKIKYGLFSYGFFIKSLTKSTAIYPSSASKILKFYEIYSNYSLTTSRLKGLSSTIIIPSN
jgi:hypothetical protein